MNISMIFGVKFRSSKLGQFKRNMIVIGRGAGSGSGPSPIS